MDEWRKAEAETVRAEQEGRRAEELAGSATAVLSQVNAAEELM